MESRDGLGYVSCMEAVAGGQVKCQNSATAIQGKDYR